jgi:hypothetical protein
MRLVASSPTLPNDPADFNRYTNSVRSAAS